jgi:hypothetical protein
LKDTTHPCHRCLQPVDYSAKRCPHCGEPQPGVGAGKIILVILGAAVVVGILVFVVLKVVGPYETP